MPSPFPGTDPYLEGSEWTSVHTALAVEIVRQLTPRLLPRYIARTEKRYVITSLEPTGAPPAGMAAAPLTIATVVPERVPQVAVEIRDTAQRQLVTAIEILSPTNKQGADRGEYLERRQRFLLSHAHLVEVDLLRRGQRVPMQQHLPSVPYFAFVGRADRRPLTEVWPITLRMPLPTIPVPLLAGDADVPLDLQHAFDAVYDGCAYGASTDYTRPAEIPLSEDDAEWAKEQVGGWTQRGLSG